VDVKHGGRWISMTLSSPVKVTSDDTVATVLGEVTDRLNKFESLRRTRGVRLLAETKLEQLASLESTEVTLPVARSRRKSGLTRRGGPVLQPWLTWWTTGLPPRRPRPCQVPHGRASGR
jgi:hypothetical protein